MPDQTETELPALLAAAIAGWVDFPSSLKLLKQLEATEKAARLVLAAMANLPFRSLLLENNERIENEREGVALLREIAARCGQALERNRRRSGAGRPKKIIPVVNWPRPLELCALMVGVRWRLERNRWPGQHNPEAQRCCEELWISAGGAPHGKIASPDGALTAWRIHLKAAKQYEAQPIGAYLAHIIAPPIRRRLKSPLPRSLYDYPRSMRAPRFDG